MSRAFESEVYAERQRLPGVSIDVKRLLEALLWSIENGEAKLTVQHRRDVDTREWWELHWGKQFVGATSLELCLFRAAVRWRKDDERTRKYAGLTPASPPTADPK